MAKIKINCGHCGKYKGCEIRKSFRELAGSIYTGEEVYNPEFKLSCPISTPVFEKYEKVKFTVAYGRHQEVFNWECDLDTYGEDACRHCRFKDQCNDAVVEFVNTRYYGSVELNGVIYSQYKKGYFIIKVSASEFDKYKELCNDDDLKIINEISNSLDIHDDDRSAHHYFISKRKFIELHNTEGK